MKIPFRKFFFHYHYHFNSIGIITPNCSWPVLNNAALLLSLSSITTVSLSDTFKASKTYSGLKHISKSGPFGNQRQSPIPLLLLCCLRLKHQFTLFKDKFYNVGPSLVINEAILTTVINSSFFTSILLSLSFGITSSYLGYCPSIN